MENGERYKPYLIKEYQYWILNLNPDRALPFIGRAVAWWKDRKPHEGEGMSLLDIAGAPVNELIRRVFVDMCRGCKALGYATHTLGSEFLINTSYLANEPSHNHHMHWHLVPRWEKPFHMTALGRIVTDPVWEAHYHAAYERGLDTPFKLLEDDLQRIRHVMSDAVN